jgi:hypothetical protein
MYIFDGLRSILPGPIPPGTAVDTTAQVVAPSRAGHYRLEPRLVQEQVAWLDGEENAKPRFFEIEVE